MTDQARDIHTTSKKRIVEKQLAELRQHLTNAEDCLNTLYMLGYDVGPQIIVIEQVDQRAMQVCRAPCETNGKENNV